ncbi:MAG: hypothetical protein HY695_30685 [Deltaproteobacteria bacterium]|nr:hypothetical protein [Deltaproteobacteria bacterium]
MKRGKARDPQGPMAGKRAGKRRLTATELDLLNEAKDILLSNDEWAISRLEWVVGILKKASRLPKGSYRFSYGRDGSVRALVIDGKGKDR